MSDFEIAKTDQEYADEYGVSADNWRLLNEELEAMPAAELNGLLSPGIEIDELISLLARRKWAREQRTRRGQG